MFDLIVFCVLLLFLFLFVFVFVLVYLCFCVFFRVFACGLAFVFVVLCSCLWFSPYSLCGFVALFVVSCVLYCSLCLARGTGVNRGDSHWEVSMCNQIRKLWRHYYQNSQGVIFVVDSADKERIGEARKELADMLDNEELAEASVLILANKQVCRSLTLHVWFSKPVGFLFFVLVGVARW